MKGSLIAAASIAPAGDNKLNSCTSRSRRLLRRVRLKSHIPESGKRSWYALKLGVCPVLAAALFVAPGGAFSAEATTTTGTTSDDDQAAELAKKLSNPISSLISVPFQSNWDFGLGDGNGQRFTMNFQPVVPISLSKDWNLILRTIVPVINQLSAFGPLSGNQTGLGNTTQSFFLSPKAPGPGGIIWGLGPVGYYPTNTDKLLGPDRWGLGPTLVALVQPGSWTIGILANQIWSVGSGNDETNISALYMQPFIAYNTKTHTTFSLDMESTYDWINKEWTVPFNLAVAQIFKIGKLPVQAQVGVRYYAESPTGGPDWGLRAVFTLLFPTGSHQAPAPVTRTSAK